MNDVCGKGSTLLIVDDEEGLRYGLERLFEKKGFTVFSTGKFERGIEIVEKHSVDAVLLDIRLKGGKNGIDLLKLLKQIEPDLIRGTMRCTAERSFDQMLAPRPY